MTTRTKKRGYSWFAGVLLATGAVGAAVTMLPSASWSNDERAVPEGLPRVPVTRTNLEVTVTATGDLNSAENTLIECELERFRERSAGGQRISTSGRAMIIDIVPEGTMVKKGDVLCQIDGSEYVEMIRQKEIEVEQSQSELEQTELDLQTAEIELTEYLEGLRIQEIQNYEGEIKLAESQYQRQLDRIDWSSKMLPLGYISLSSHQQEQLLLLTDQINLDRVQEAYKNYKRYTVPKTVQTLETEVDKKLSTAIYMRRRHERQLERLAQYKEQLENCVVRAPHDGYVIYAEDRRRDQQLAVGVEVREHMDLFHLPNLDRMQAEVSLNETVVERVAEGNKARIRVVAFPDQVLEGRVKKVEQLPLTNRYSRIKDDVREYRAIVEIESLDGLMPKMEAEVEILTDERPDALVMPAEALTIERGQSVCYVAKPEGLERRTVEVEPGTIEMLEVVEGLVEGEEVVLHPDRYELAELVIERREDAIATSDPADAGQAQAALESPLLH